MRLSTNRILEITGGRVACPARDADRVLTDLTWDSRTAREGCVYAALPGERVDGNDFIAAAIEAGAGCVLAGRMPDERECDVARRRGAAVIVLDDVHEGIVALASAWRDMLDAVVVGITGSVGKTTTKALVRDVLSARFKTCATKGNFNNQLGAPYTVLAADPDCEMLVVEMGMDGAGQIASICETARPDMGLINNVGVSHLERLGSRENIARAKSELFDALRSGSRAFVNADDDMATYVREVARLDARGISVVLFSGSKEPEGVDDAVWADACRVDEEGRPSFVLHARGFDAPAEGVSCSLRLRGLHNVSNACAAAAVASACGMELAEIARALGSAEPEAGRQEVKRAACGATVFDDSYNASPVSMAASLAMLAAYKAPGRKIAVLGDMGELGEACVQGHIETGRAAARAHVDMLICVGEASRGIAEGALDAGMDAACVVRVACADDAVRALEDTIEATDVVLVKASRFMGLDRVVEGVVA